MRILTIAMIIALVTATAACVGRALSSEETYQRQTDPDGLTVESWAKRRSESQTPTKPVSPATTAAGTSLASSGNQDAPDQALAQLAWMPWVGTGLIVVGLLSIVGRAWLPFLAVLPLGASWGLIAFGAGLLILPTLIDRYSGVIMILIAAGAALFAAWWIGLFDNIRARATAYTPMEPKP